LAGVDEPFWKDLPYTDICKVICQDTLHGLHKAFKDHTAQWSINRITPFEIDNRVRRMPKSPGFRHFSGGISKISQWSGREAKDLERIFLSVLPGAQTPGAIIATRAELDFIYTAGWKMLGDDDLKRMRDFNSQFHRHKDAFLRTEDYGGRELDHFNIPKIHGRHHYPDNICWLAAPHNYSTEISERYHIEIAKKAHKATNRKDYLKQMLLWLTRQEKIHLRGLFFRWSLNEWSRPSNTDNQCDGFLPDSDIIEGDESEREVQGEGNSMVDGEEDQETSLVSQMQVTPSLKTSCTMKAATVSHSLATRPHYSRQPLSWIMQNYGIPQLETALKTYLLESEAGHSIPHQSLRHALAGYSLPPIWMWLSIWNRCTVTLPLVGFDTGNQERRTILARLRSPKDPVPRFQTVFVDPKVDDPTPQDGIKGTVAQFTLCSSSLICSVFPF
jgi:hypothetical protein